MGSLNPGIDSGISHLSTWDLSSPILGSLNYGISHLNIWDLAIMGSLIPQLWDLSIMGALISQLWDLSISQLWDLSSLNYGISHLSIMGPLNYGISQLWDRSSLNMGSLNPLRRISPISQHGISQSWDRFSDLSSLNMGSLNPNYGISRFGDLSSQHRGSLNYGISHLSIMGSLNFSIMGSLVSQLWDLSSLNYGTSVRLGEGLGPYKEGSLCITRQKEKVKSLFSEEKLNHYMF
jgi:hypothetical protein